MWELELLSYIIPAFGVLAREFMEAEHHDTRLQRDAQECYADLVTIGLAVYMSGGEWASGLDDIDVTKLLTALETRFPTRKTAFPNVFAAPRASEVCLFPCQRQI